MLMTRNYNFSPTQNSMNTKFYNVNVLYTVSIYEFTSELCGFVIINADKNDFFAVLKTSRATAISES